MSFQFSRIADFNKMYAIPSNKRVPLDREAMGRRLEQFVKILADEISEVEEIAEFLPLPGKETDAVILTMLADWLGDIIVYCSSEALRHGIPLEDVLNIIMDSNASKLQADGTPLFVEGKLQKGPGYWKPEPKIKDLILSMKEQE
jgi:predicted HAD superfamily Cof-like phosphohydrolase